MAKVFEYKGNLELNMMCVLEGQMLCIQVYYMEYLYYCETNVCIFVNVQASDLFQELDQRNLGICSGNRL
jgi:hypothetical protein